MTPPPDALLSALKEAVEAVSDPSLDYDNWDAWMLLRDHGLALIEAVEGREDERREELKTAFVAGCCAVLTWTHSGMPQDDLDEAGYDYASQILALQPKAPTP